MEQLSQGFGALTFGQATDSSNPPLLPQTINGTRPLTTDEQDHAPSLRSRCLGSMYGSAAGDAFGAAFEFEPRGCYEAAVSSGLIQRGVMVGRDTYPHTPWDIPAGAFTDDTSQALCIGSSLLAKRSFQPVDILDRNVKWAVSLLDDDGQHGYMCSVKKRFDIGTTSQQAVITHQFQSAEQKAKDLYKGVYTEQSNSNGSVMRMSPIAVFFRNDREMALDMADSNSGLTHGSRRCRDTCRLTASIVLAALDGKSKEEMLNPESHPNAVMKSNFVYDIIHNLPSTTEYDVTGDYNGPDTLKSALWAFRSSSTFEEGMMKVVNIGQDTDTTAAVYGMIAGAYYGYEAIPQQWRDTLARPDLLKDIFEGVADYPYQAGIDPENAETYRAYRARTQSGRED